MKRALLAAGLVLAACSAGTSPARSPTPARSIALLPTVGILPVVSPSPDTCHGPAPDLPDPHCTPGALNPEVNQGNIGQTICMSGWSTVERHKWLPESESARFKRQVASAYGIPLSQLSNMEGDHEISIELGGLPGPMPGAADFTLNFWDEPNDHPKPGVLNSKDLVENAAHAAVCARTLSLADAQHSIATDWKALGRRLHVL